MGAESRTPKDFDVQHDCSALLGLGAASQQLILDLQEDCHLNEKTNQKHKIMK